MTAETATERRLRLGRFLSDLLADRAIDHLTGQQLPAEWEAVSLDDGEALGLLDDEWAVRHVESGEVWLVDVEVTCQPITPVQSDGGAA